MEQKINIDGKGLERAIYNIERQILGELEKSDIGLITVQKNKLIKKDGVRHEIDIYVKVDLKIGTELIYIFECKDYRLSNRAISKNDIIVFEEKISVCNAQRGYFVATRFGKDSINQSHKYDRMKLLTFSSDFDSIKEDLTITKSRVFISARASLMTYPYTHVDGDFSRYILKVNGEEKGIALGDRLSQVVNCIAQGKEPIVDNAEVKILLDEENLRIYSVMFKKCVFNDVKHEYLTIVSQVELDEADAEVIVAYDVSTKGKYIKQRIKNFDNQSYMTLEITSVKDGYYNVNFLDL